MKTLTEFIVKKHLTGAIVDIKNADRIINACEKFFVDNKITTIKNSTGAVREYIKHPERQNNPVRVVRMTTTVYDTDGSRKIPRYTLWVIIIAICFYNKPQSVADLTEQVLTAMKSLNDEYQWFKELTSNSMERQISSNIKDYIEQDVLTDDLRVNIKNL